MNMGVLEKRILKLLWEQDRPRSWIYIHNRLGHQAYEPLQNLVRKGRVMKTRSGPWEMYELVQQIVIE